ncbi:hypothetical protein AYI68_g1224 [Smittium mucronatum]|uniref:Uncharacterized protein n=1 Tax=Smittium mucronatum TaxID=133383 RepID=A0A1R0H636_9FUNG|nr:hypothetical protein AYI68_g1224 [Smittium mucronatum]
MTAQTEWSLSDQQFELGGLFQPLLLPALESDRSSDSEGETRAANYYPGHTIVENCDMVLGSRAIIDKTATASTNNKRVPDPKSGKSPLSNTKKWHLMTWRIS